MTLTSSWGQQTDVWFGTSTSKNGASKGIYHATFNAKSGTLSEASLAVEVGSPGFLAMHPAGDKIYAACRTAAGASVAGYKVQEDGTLRLINAQLIGDGGAAHLVVHPKGNMVLTAQYGGGSVAVFPLAANGEIGERTQLHKHEGGSKVVPGRQEKPHAHWIGFDASGSYGFCPDLGMDGTVIYKVNAEANAVEPVGFAAGPPGGGPRHMKFFGDYAYVLNELSLAVTSYRYDGKGGLEQLGTVPSLSEEVKAQETFNSASEIRVHPSGKFVYSANRGHDSITVYRADENGSLVVVEVEPIRGAWPRNFNLDASGKWLLAAGQDSDSVAVFAIDQENGKLAYQRARNIHVPTPICVLFGK